MLQRAYDRHIAPRLIHAVCSRSPFPRQREQVVPRASGDVLEIGIGSGLNLPYYDTERVLSICAVEPDEVMRTRVMARGETRGLALDLRADSAETLPFDTDRFDTVLTTFTLCSIADLSSALAEMRRVLKPTGRLRFAEHGRSPEPRVYAWQRRLNPIQKCLGGGCQLDVDIPRVLTDAGFELLTLEEGYVPGPKVFAYHYWGEAKLRPEGEPVKRFTGPQ